MGMGRSPVFHEIELKLSYEHLYDCQLWTESELSLRFQVSVIKVYHTSPIPDHPTPHPTPTTPTHDPGPPSPHPQPPTHAQ